MILLSEIASMSQRQLVDATGGDKASMVRVIDDLERLGLAVRLAFPGDRRMHAVCLTDEGLAVFDAAHEKAAVIATGLVAHLSPGEPERLFELLTDFTCPHH
jgi:DNA-binding MarR family transcriptional regulator